MGLLGWRQPAMADCAGRWWFLRQRRQPKRTGTRCVWHLSVQWRRRAAMGLLGWRQPEMEFEKSIHGELPHSDVRTQLSLDPDQDLACSRPADDPTGSSRAWF